MFLNINNNKKRFFTFALLNSECEISDFFIINLIKKKTKLFSIIPILNENLLNLLIRIGGTTKKKKDFFLC